MSNTAYLIIAIISVGFIIISIGIWIMLGFGPAIISLGVEIAILGFIIPHIRFIRDMYDDEW